MRRLSTGVVMVGLWCAQVFAVDAAERVLGKCLDENGAPLEGAEVLLYYNPFPEGWGKIPKELGGGVAARTQTDAEGVFSFPASLLTYSPKPVPRPDTSRRPAAYYLLAKHSDRAVAALLLERGKETEPRELVLRPGVAQKVYAVSEGKRKDRIPGARIWLHLIHGRSSKVPEWTSEFCLNEDIDWVGGTTDANGMCAISNLPPVDCCFYATKDGYASTWRGGIKAPKSRNVWFDMTPGATANGRAVLPDGKPATNLLVKFVVGGNRTWVSYAVTDENGSFNSPPLRTHKWDRKAWPDLEELHDGVVTLVAECFLTGSPFVSSETITLDTNEEMTFDELVLKVTRMASAPLHIKVVAPDGTPLTGFETKLMTRTPGDRSLETVGRIKTYEHGLGSVELPEGEVMLSPVRRMTKVPGWYVPEDSHYLSLSRIQDRWGATHDRVSPNALLALRGGKGTQTEPLLIEAGVVRSKSLSGVVTDAGGKPLSDCSLYTSHVPAGVRSDAAGGFVFDCVPAGKDMQVFAISEDRKLAALTDTTAATTGGVTIALMPTGDYRGRCVDCEGLSVGKMSLRIDPKLAETTIYRCREDVTTDDRGRFVLHNACTNAVYHVWWSPDDKINRDFDYGRADVDISELAADKPFTVEVKRYIETTMGTVVDQDGDPVSHARVRIDDWSMLPQDGRGTTYRTDGSGEFEIRRLAKGKVGLTFSHGAHGDIRLEDVPTDSVDVEVVLPPRGSSNLFVKVAAPDGKPFEGAKVILFGTRRSRKTPDDSEELRREATTDSDGMCAFATIECDADSYYRWTVLCDVPGHYYEVRPVKMGLDHTIAIALARADRPLAGTVRSWDGKPLAGAEVVAKGIGYLLPDGRRGRLDNLPPELMLTSTDQAGRFAFQRIDAGRPFCLLARAPGCAEKTLDQWSTPDGAVQTRGIDLTLLPGCEISGNVYREETGAPTAGVRVVAASMEGSWIVSGNTVTDADGMYRIENLAPGSYEVVAFPDGKTRGEWTCEPLRNVEARAGKPASDRAIVLVKGVTIGGTVTDVATGNPIGDTPVSAYVANRPRSLARAGARTNAEGRYTLRVLPGRTYRVVTHYGQPAASKDIAVDKDGTYDGIDFSITLQH